MRLEALNGRVEWGGGGAAQKSRQSVEARGLKRTGLWFTCVVYVPDILNATTPHAPAEYKDKDVITPAIVLNQRRQRRAQQALTQDESVNEYKSGESKPCHGSIPCSRTAAFFPTLTRLPAPRKIPSDSCAASLD